MDNRAHFPFGELGAHTSIYQRGKTVEKSGSRHSVCAKGARREVVVLRATRRRRRRAQGRHARRPRRAASDRAESGSSIANAGRSPLRVMRRGSRAASSLPTTGTSASPAPAAGSRRRLEEVARARVGERRFRREKKKGAAEYEVVIRQQACRALLFRLALVCSRAPVSLSGPRDEAGLRPWPALR